MRRLFPIVAVIAVAYATPARADEADVHYRQGRALKDQGKTDEAVAELLESLMVIGC
jgi:hypothetical protein